ncbi:uncharacterized protein LOC108608308 [Drosophila busckii]|uniref:uncharacterized protein LOC108608308 n=1 Tax=Drosophila busckii TaxID=30019 RepID=UPI001432DE8B|nr:uncharacterized protein LOC108608308 [Drosophila busckii]
MLEVKCSNCNLTTPAKKEDALEQLQTELLKPLTNATGRRHKIAGPRQAKRVKYMPAMWSGVKLGFISTARAAPLTAFQMAKLKAAILETTLTCITPGFRPRFAGCVPRQLWMLLICVDNNAADWVRSNFGQIKANSSLDIELLEEQQFPQAHLIRGYFHNSLHLSNETLLGYIEAQNEISTRQWRVVRRTVEGAMLHAAILVDEESLVTLTRWAGKIWYCFGRTKLILRNSFLKNKAANETFNQSLPNSH